MPRIAVPGRRVLLLGAVASLAVGLGLMLMGRQPARADSKLSQSLPSVKDDWKKFHYQEAKECKQCHAVPGVDRKDSLELCLLTEYSIWKTNDKHAQAYLVLKGPRGQKMERILKQDVTRPETGCLNCHAMDNLNAVNKTIQGAPTLDLQDGVSCAGCHGPSGGDGGWLGPHAQKTWREKTPEQKYKQGLRDLRDPVIRAELCFSCHIGNAAEGKVVTHAMMAAGHPPLPPIEIATFSRNEPQHWRDARDVPLFAKDPKKHEANYHLKDLEFNRTRFALIGMVVAVRETARLARDRGNFKDAADPKLFWPELVKAEGDLKARAAKNWPEIAMAHSDCFACHHDLKFPGFRQKRGFGYDVAGLEPVPVIPGRPMVRTWPLAGLKLAGDHCGADLGKLRDRLKALAQATNVRPFGKPEQIVTSTDELIKWCDSILDSLRKADFSRDKVLKLARDLASLYDTRNNRQIPDYETARQLASLLLVICDDLRLKDRDAVAAMDRLRADVNVVPYIKREDRTKVVFDVIEDVLKAKDDKAFKDGAAEFLGYLKNVADDTLLKKWSEKGNPFLDRVSLRLSNKDFTDGLQSAPVIKKLQELSDAEQRHALKIVADYDPKVFLEQMKKVASYLPR